MPYSPSRLIYLIGHHLLWQQCGEVALVRQALLAACCMGAWVLASAAREPASVLLFFPMSPPLCDCKMVIAARQVHFCP
jgi:hypothetical protein